MMKRTFIAVAAAAALGSVALAQTVSPAIKDRKETMKGVGQATAPVGKMLKGEEKFDIAKVQLALTTYQNAAKKMPGLFPPDSKTGGETTVLPAIWEKKSEFDAGFKKLADAAATAAKAIKDEASFKTEWPKVTSNCGACHKAFRVPPKQ
ncbi:MAG: cytochrome c [Hyphomicrobiaceae bacterium]|nr:MAG: cytochrome c [Hyphomicrobiaceae bacterium]